MPVAVGLGCPGPCMQDARRGSAVRGAHIPHSTARMHAASPALGAHASESSRWPAQQPRLLMG